MKIILFFSCLRLSFSNDYSQAVGYQAPAVLMITGCLMGHQRPHLLHWAPGSSGNALWYASVWHKQDAAFPMPQAMCTCCRERKLPEICQPLALSKHHQTTPPLQSGPWTPWGVRPLWGWTCWLHPTRQDTSTSPAGPSSPRGADSPMAFLKISCF